MYRSFKLIKHFFALIVLIAIVCSSVAQRRSTDLLAWSAERKLTFADFKQQKAPANAQPSFAEFSVDFKYINKKVSNYFVRSGSWIDTTVDAQRSLRYQQAVFDLCEIAVRQFRKELSDNRKQLNRKTADELHEKCLQHFSDARVKFDLDTRFGTDEAAMQTWRQKIDEELAGLLGFAAE